jgi:hypothetical protein
VSPLTLAVLSFLFLLFLAILPVISHVQPLLTTSRRPFETFFVYFPKRSLGSPHGGVSLLISQFSLPILSSNSSRFLWKRRISILFTCYCLKLTNPLKPLQQLVCNSSPIPILLSYMTTSPPPPNPSPSTSPAGCC